MVKNRKLYELAVEIEVKYLGGNGDDGEDGLQENYY